MTPSTPINSQTIDVEATLDVQAIERELNDLWMQNAGAASPSEEGAMLRARVLNLMVYLTSEEVLRAVDEMLMDVAVMHPCRAIVMLADSSGEDKDIEMQVSSRCRIERAGGRHLCCEQVTMRAGGRFTVELPSACVPLLVTDLPVFLWWRAPLGFDDQTFRSLMRAADRVIVDTAECLHPYEELRALAGFLGRGRRAQMALSDLNWARLTAWRTLLASFYDAPEHASSLERLSRVRIEYVAGKNSPATVAPKALILAGWLASRLGWHVSEAAADGAQTALLEKDGRTLFIEFKQVEHSAVRHGGLARVELIAEAESQMSLVVMRAGDGRNLETRAAFDAEPPGAARVLVGGDKTEAQLLAGEMTILSHDRIYEEAVARAVELLDALS